MEWQSDLLNEWQNDIRTLEGFCTEGLEIFRKRMKQAANVKDSSERARMISSARQSLDSMLQVASKWENLPAFYLDMEGYAEKINGAREKWGLDKMGLGDCPASETIPEQCEVGSASPKRDEAKTEFHSRILPKILEYYKKQGVVGEERLCLLQTMCAANRVSFGVEGPSGSGKTFVVDNLIKMMPEWMVYRIGLSSDNAIFNDIERLNKAEFIYIPELQKAMRRQGSTVEAIKDLTEGKDAVRVVTAGKGSCSEYRIAKGKTVIYTLAHENGFKKDVETGRRLVALHTDSSLPHVSDVLAEKAGRRCSPETAEFTDEDLEALKSHFCNCALSECRFQDPFAVYMSRHIPNIPKAVGFIDSYYSVLDACAKLNYLNRLEHRELTFLNIEDHYIAHLVYHADFCRNLASICTDEEKKIVESAKSGVDWQKCWDSGVTVMLEKFPEIAGDWIEMQGKGGSIAVYDPIAKKDVLLAGGAA